MSDKLLWGTSRPLFRIGTSRYVLNDPPASNNTKWPKRIILNESINGKEFEHILGYKGFVTVNWEILDRPSCELFRTILDSTALYMRPHWNHYAEYLVRAMNGFELDRFGKVNQPYKGTLVFTTKTFEADIPLDSYGSIQTEVNTRIDTGTLTVNMVGDISMEIKFKTPADWPVVDTLLIQAGAVHPIPNWSLILKTTDQKLQFKTDNGVTTHELDSSIVLSPSTWYHAMIRRVNTDEKRIVVNGTQVGSASDTYIANDMNRIYVGKTTSNGVGFLMQVFRSYEKSISSNFNHYAIEAIPSGDISDLKVWWDLSEGAATDLSGNNNDGTLAGTQTFVKEVYPDPNHKILT